MQADVESIIADLSIRLFDVSPQQVEEALTVSRVDPDRSLVDEIAGRGLLDDHAHGVLVSLYAQLQRHQEATRSGYFPPILTPRPGSGVDAGPLEEDRGGLATKSEALHAGGSARYHIMREHATGGMGRILAVWDRRMQREVALKEVRPGHDGPGHRRVLARFLQEARITGRLQHPSIIPVHEIGEREDGTLYYTMKFVRGRTLQQAIQANEDLAGRMALLPHYLNLCHAVAYAHAHGVIHRDIKPSNVMLGEFGETLVIDWGLAKETAKKGSEHNDSSPHDLPEEESISFDLTVDGQLLGTPHYMSPEQAAGRHDTLDARADVYALGAVLYELLTGSRPYRASTGLEVLRKAAVEPPAPPEMVCPEVSPALAAICQRAMARRPQDRYPTAAELAEDVNRYLAGARVEAYNYGLREHLARFVQRHRPVVITAALAMAILAGVVVYAYLSLRARHAAEHTLRIAAERERYDLSVALAQNSVNEHQYDRAYQLLEDCPPDYRGWEWGRLRHVVQTVQRTLIGHEGRVEDIAVAPDGRLLVTVEAASTALVRELPSGRIVQTITTHDTDLCAVAVHPQGREIVTCAISGAIRRWDSQTGQPFAGAPLEPRPLRAAVYAPDGQSLIGAGQDATVFLWDLATGSIIREFRGDGAAFNHVSVSPDSRWIAAGDVAGALFLWDGSTGTRHGAVQAHTNHRQLGLQGTLHTVFSHDSQYLATSGCDITAKLWRVDGLELLRTFTGYIKKVNCADFSPDDHLLATVSEGDLTFWNVESGEEQPNWIRCPERMEKVRFVPNSSLMVTSGSESFARLWDLSVRPDGDYLTAHQEEVNTVRFSPDGRYLASGGGHWLRGGDGRLLIWDLGSDGQAVPEAPLRVLDGALRWINAVDFHPDEQRLIAGDAKGRILMWDWHTGALLREIPVPEYTNGLRCIAIAPDGDRFATTGWATDVEMPIIIEWSTETGERLREFTGQKRAIDSVAYSADGRYIAAGSRDGTAMVWDCKSGLPVSTFITVEGWSYGVAFSPDSRTLAMSNGRRSVELMDLATGQSLHRLDGLNDRSNKVVFTPDGTRVASCDITGTKVWNAVTGAPLLTLPHGANDLAFSPDGRTLVTAGVDGRIGIWHSVDWRVIKPD